VIDARFAGEDRAMALARETSARGDQVDALLVAAGTSPLQHAVRIAEIAKRQGVELDALFAAVGVGADLSRDAMTTVGLELKYDGYFKRERIVADRMKRMGEFVIPDDAPYELFKTLSVEARQKLARRKPATLAQAASVPGVSPADVQNLVLEIEKLRGLRAATS
jgi:tRNA uridine 5-carboxymethylaminomethyl modification enzyme